MSFFAHVFGWFTTSSNWYGPAGHPPLVLAPAQAVGGGRRDRGGARRRARRRSRPHRQRRTGRGQRGQRLPGRAHPGPPHPPRDPARDLTQVERLPRRLDRPHGVGHPADPHQHLRRDARGRRRRARRGEGHGPDRRAGRCAPSRRRWRCPSSWRACGPPRSRSSPPRPSPPTSATPTSARSSSAGSTTNNSVLAFSGALLVAAMAGLVALVLTLLTRVLTPRPLRRRRAVRAGDTALPQPVGGTQPL